MKAFWAVLAALLLAGGVFVVMSARANSARAVQAQVTAAEQAQQAQQEAALRAAAATEQQKRQAAADATIPDVQALAKQQKDLNAKLEASKQQLAELEKQTKQGTPKAAVPDVAAAGDQAKGEDPKAEPPKTDAAKPGGVPDGKTGDAKQDKPTDPKPDGTPEKKEADQPKPSSNGGFSINDASVAPVGVTGAPTSGTPKAVVATVKQDKPTFAGFEVIPAKIEKKDDGSMMVDGKYLIKGEGTAEKPYVVPWDVLTSVEETFDPQSGKKKLPERVTMLDGKVVKFAGYVAFPLMMKEAKECLSMLNQWDGCCIGVPPTPYDAVEVSLSRTIKGEERFTTSGVVTGVFRVKPYLQGDWLIGLYVMEGGELKSRDFGGSAGS
jgi:hypothetical protein